MASHVFNGLVVVSTVAVLWLTAQSGAHSGVDARGVFALSANLTAIDETEAMIAPQVIFAYSLIDSPPLLRIVSQDWQPTARASDLREPDAEAALDSGHRQRWSARSVTLPVAAVLVDDVGPALYRVTTSCTPALKPASYIYSINGTRIPRARNLAGAVAGMTLPGGQVRLGIMSPNGTLTTLDHVPVNVVYDRPQTCG